MNLLKLSLPTFSGDPTQWVGFWDIFTCSIDKNTELTDVQKLTYLRGQLDGDSKQLLAGFKQESISYAPSVKLLIDHNGQID